MIVAFVQNFKIAHNDNHRINHGPIDPERTVPSKSVNNLTVLSVKTSCEDEIRIDDSLRNVLKENLCVETLILKTDFVEFWLVEENLFLVFQIADGPPHDRESSKS